MELGKRGARLPHPPPPRGLGVRPRNLPRSLGDPPPLALGSQRFTTVLLPPPASRFGVEACPPPLPTGGEEGFVRDFPFQGFGFEPGGGSL
eukprot:scaffold416_cov329-Pavlova_lutheri.AAC.32